MSRPNKYRAWNKNTNKWIYDHDLIMNSEGKLCCCYSDKTFGEWKIDYEIVFYIGENDKHGNEICEGDICGGMYQWGATIGVITYELGCFILKYTNDSSFHTAADIDFGNLEILGNIFENKDLLTDSSGEKINGNE